MAEKQKKKSYLIARIVLVLLIVAALGISLIWEKQINVKLGFAREEPTQQPSTPAARESIDLDVHFVDVGQGDACILELPDDRVMLIDSGETDRDDVLIHYIEDNITRDGKPLEYFDIVMITHSDSDHCGEMADVLEKFPAKTFYRPNVAADNGKDPSYVDPGKDDLYGNYRTKDTAAYRNAINAGYAHADTTYASDARDDRQNVIKPTNIAAGQAGYYTITMYTPTTDTYPTDWNNYSPIMILEYEGQRIALSGDAEKEAEAEFVTLAEQRQGKFSIFDDRFYVNLIKLGHHGSKTSSSQAYLDVMTTEASCPATFAIASCGEFSEYGHPAPETIERLKSMGFTEDHILTTHDKRSGEKDTPDGTIVASIKLDENYAYALFVGGATGGEVKTFQWRWLYIAAIIAGVAVVLLLIVPAFFGHGGKVDVDKKGNVRVKVNGKTVAKTNRNQKRK